MRYGVGTSVVDFGGFAEEPGNLEDGVRTKRKLDRKVRKSLANTVRVYYRHMLLMCAAVMCC